MWGLAFQAKSCTPESSSGKVHMVTFMMSIGSVYQGVS